MTSPSHPGFRSTHALALLAGAFLTGPLTASILQGAVTNPANGHTYYLLTQNTWTASEAEAVTLGGHLVTANDADNEGSRLQP